MRKYLTRRGIGISLVTAIFLSAFVPQVFAIYSLPGFSEEIVRKYCSAKSQPNDKKFICDLYTKLNFISVKTFDNETRVIELENQLGRKAAEIRSLESQLTSLIGRVNLLEARNSFPTFPIPSNPLPINPIPQQISTPSPQIYPIPLPIGN